MLSKPCIRCGQLVTAKYQSKLDRKRFCRECGIREGARQKDRKVTKNCTICGKEFRVKRTEVKRINCSWKCGYKSRSIKISGKNHPRYRGKKRYTKGDGSPYEWVYVGGVRYYKHRYLMEQKIGRKLRRDEIVHHKNEDKKDNRIENLELMSRADHTKLHYQY